MTLNPTTLQALEAFPRQLEAHYAAIPAGYQHWAPPSWEGVPSEAFTAIEQVCHVRDIEVEGYHVRFRRTLDEDGPVLASIDSEPIAKERDYGSANVGEVFASFRQARAETMKLLTDVQPAQLDRRAVFEGYGPLTLRSLVHYLCSHDQQHLAGLQWLAGKIAAVRAPG
jgi:hypothetical protein